jgi:integrase
VESTAKWLRAHPGTEIVSRDRASLYAQAATKAAPQAVQVADRWHLLHNLTEAFIGALVPHHRLLSETARSLVKDTGGSSSLPSAKADGPTPRIQAKQRLNREHRLAKYEAVMDQVHTINRRLVAINQAHRAAGFSESPASTRDPLVGATLKGIRRTLGTAQKGKAPLVAEGIRALVAASPERLLGLRDRSMFLTGYAGGFRRASLAMIETSDVVDRADGIGVMLRKSKTDQEGAGRVVPIKFGTQEETCPVLALRAWRTAANITHGPLYRGVDRHGHVSPHGLNPDSIGRILKRAAARAGMPSADLGGHSLRAGLVTQCAIARVNPFTTMEITGHKSLAVLRLYVRLGYLSGGISASELGL